LIRCATAAAANYGEAQGAESRKDFVHKMRLCLKELRETHVWLKLLRELAIADEAELEGLILEANELIAIFFKSVETALGNLSAAS
jgi:four helix bundle protein